MMEGLTGTKGGSGVWQRIISEMPEHDVYIEPFWGRGTIAKKKRPAGYTIGIDLDPVAVSSGNGHALMFLADGIQWMEDYFQLPALLDSDSLPGATSRKAARAAETGAARGTPVSASQDPDGEHSGGRPTPNEAAPAGACTFGGVPWERHFVYLDPPYIGCDGYYRHRLTLADHRRLCRLFRCLPCPAALSGYDSDLYAEELAGCRTIRIPTTNRAGKRCTEVVWLNYAPPTRYHDTRFCGLGRRERERIRRRVKTWSAGLRRMPPAERQAVYEACAAHYRVIAGIDAENSDATR